MLNFQVDKLTEVLRAFYNTTGARVAIYDEYLNEIICYPAAMCPLCVALRQSQDVDKRCRHSDKSAFATCAKTQKMNVYECYMGLYEATSPIVIGGRVEGYMMMGQVVALSGREEVLRRAGRYFQDLEPIKSLLWDMETIPFDKLNSITYLMNLCVEYLCSANYIAPTHSGKAKKIDRYLLAHLAEPLSVDDICDTFHISRTTLHNTMQQAYGVSVTKRRNTLKVEAAKTMLRQGSAVGEICEELGFSDKAYFYKVFKQVTGKSPKDFLFDETEAS